MSATALLAAERARAGVIAAMAAATAAAWGYLVLVTASRDDMMSLLAMPMTSAWTPVQAVLMFVMWAVMMAAMMLPSAIPMVAAYDRLDSGSRQAGMRGGSTPLFIAGYLVTWSSAALLGTGLQWLFHRLAIVNAMGLAVHPLLVGGLLVGAGIYQFTPLKELCLGRCRTPMGFLMTSWREGPRGSLVMGVHHGILCVGCCWALMTLLFVLGVMNLAWVWVLATFVLIEKLAPNHAGVVRFGGVALIVWGIIVIGVA